MRLRYSLTLYSLMAGYLVCGCSSSGSKGATCAVGDKLACSCPAGGSGYRVCGADGVYGACDCSATQMDAASPDVAGAQTPSDGSGTAADVDSVGEVSSGTASADGPIALLGLYSPCISDSDCESSFCFLYNDGKRLCTKTCAASSECPAPSTGCNAKGVCKNPM